MIYPLLFTYDAPVFGNGFLADVAVRGGRAVVSIETGGFWFSGVNPGGLAADGGTFEAAHTAFRTTLTSVLYDLAEEATDFEAFRKAVEAFFNEKNGPTALEWDAAVALVRKNTNLTVNGLRRESAETPLAVTVTMRKARDFTSRFNKLGPQEDQLATAA
jgi:hypothetical protein